MRVYTELPCQIETDLTFLARKADRVCADHARRAKARAAARVGRDCHIFIGPERTRIVGGQLAPE